MIRSLSLRGHPKLNTKPPRRGTSLIVDDDQKTLRSMEFVLKSANFRVTATVDSQEALGKIASARHSCCPVEHLITDIQMPIFTRLISAYSNQELQFELLRLGYDNLLIKPFDKEALVGRVTKLLEQKNQQQKMN